MNTMGKRVIAGAVAGVLVLAPAACGDDEDGDGGTTDEEVEDVENTVDDLEQEAEDLGNEAEEEIESQDQGNNQDGE